MAGESADVDKKAEDFIVNVPPGLKKGNAAEDIYNADETGLFLNACRTKRTVLATRNVTAEIKVKIDLQ
jgi:hypothetical protein